MPADLFTVKKKKKGRFINTNSLVLLGGGYSCREAVGCGGETTTPGGGREQRTTPPPPTTLRRPPGLRSVKFVVARACRPSWLTEA